MGGFYLQFIWD